jgi:hypothetical protein
MGGDFYKIYFGAADSTIGSAVVQVRKINNLDIE